MIDMCSEEPDDIVGSALPRDDAAGEPTAGAEPQAADEAQGAGSGSDSAAEAASDTPTSDGLPAADPELGPELAAAVATVNAELDAGVAAAVADAQAWAAQIRRVTALQEAVRQAEKAGMPQYPQLDIAGSWRISQHTAARLMHEADRFVEALPLTLSLMEAGELWRPQAYVLLHRTSNCTAEIAQAVEAEVLPAGAALCPADLGKLVTRTVLRVESEQADAAAAEQRLADAAAERRTFTRADDDGMAFAGAVLTAQQAVAWKQGLDELERRERIADRQAGVDRTAEQRRADLFAAMPAMLLAGLGQEQTSPGMPWTLGPEQVAAQVIFNVHVPVSTVLELSREPGRLDGYGPISAEHVRLLRPTAFRRVMVDSRTGRPIAADDRPTPADPDPQRAREQVQAMLAPALVVDRDEPQHDPSARLARLIDLRDVHCSGPGCSTSRTDRDHYDPWPQGPTNAANLHRLSPRCHHAKHHGWHLIRHPDGSTTWHSPLRRSYPRPSPHSPPPRVDIYADPPPLRPPPTPAHPWAVVDDEPIAAPEPPQPPLPEPDDDPPPF
jgi:hypothetical protein